MKFIEKYGDSNWKFWKELTENEKSNYKELESYYTTYKELFENHYDDLKLYALMYRNVWLHDYYNDAISVIYFAEKYNEIVGYKKKLEEDRFSLKAQIALMFYENEALFPHVCEKYANVNLSKHRKKTPLINALKIYRNLNIPKTDYIIYLIIWIFIYRLFMLKFKTWHATKLDRFHL